MERQTDRRTEIQGHMYNEISLLACSLLSSLHSSGVPRRLQNDGQHRALGRTLPDQVPRRRVQARVHSVLQAW